MLFKIIVNYNYQILHMGYNRRLPFLNKVEVILSVLDLDHYRPTIFSPFLPTLATLVIYSIV
jgi:hypothetical protein